LSTSLLGTFVFALEPTEKVVLRFGLRDVGTPIGTPATELDELPVKVTPTAGFTLDAGTTEAFLEDPTGAGIPVLATKSGAEVILAAVQAGSGSPVTPTDFKLIAPLRLLVDLVEVS